MKLRLKDIKHTSGIDRFIIESVDLSLYIAFVQVDGEEHLIVPPPPFLLPRLFIRLF